MPLLETLHRIVGEAYCVQVERHDTNPKYRITVRPVHGFQWVQLEFFRCQCNADAALELSRSLHLAAVLAGYLASGGHFEHWADEAVSVSSDSL